MSACYRLVLDSVCRNNHHRLAILALDHLKTADAARWRNLFLRHRDAYLEGAKAPDEVFKDFKNHVLHVRDGNWGGAPQSAREWYNRTVRALRAKDWSHAAYCAGVMSHYAVDPLQPFHTHQTEEEGAIHRAVEWSLSKAFPELLLILSQDLGFPEVAAPAGDDWIEQMIIAAAKLSNKQYETLIDHYDFALGRRQPVAGLDQEMKDVVARLMGYASVMLARILDRAIAEAKADAPQVNLTLDTLVVAASAPARTASKVIDDLVERRLVGAQYDEYRRTGKVRATLSEDDRVVRKLFAEEVLKVPLSSLDCHWPRETGTANGKGAKPRVTRRTRPAKPATAKTASARVPASSRPAPANATAAAPGNASARLTREQRVVDAPSIGPKTASRLEVIGVNTIGDLLALTPEDAAQRIKTSHINAGVIRDWQSQALLACSVPELSGTNAQILVGSGVSSLEDLAGIDADSLLDAIGLFAASNEGKRLLRDGAPPGREQVEGWIKAAISLSQDRSAA